MAAPQYGAASLQQAPGVGAAPLGASALQSSPGMGAAPLQPSTMPSTLATSAGAPLMSGPSAPGTPAAQAEPPQDEEPAGNMLEVLFEMLLSTDMVYSRVYILYTASALYIKSYQFFYEE